MPSKPLRFIFNISIISIRISYILELFLLKVVPNRTFQFPLQNAKVKTAVRCRGDRSNRRKGRVFVRDRKTSVAFGCRRWDSRAGVGSFGSGGRQWAAVGERWRWFCKVKKRGVK